LRRRIPFPDLEGAVLDQGFIRSGGAIEKGHRPQGHHGQEAEGEQNEKCSLVFHRDSMRSILLNDPSFTVKFAPSRVAELSTENKAPGRA
jgi:hypothetical protein